MKLSLLYEEKRFAFFLNPKTGQSIDITEDIGAGSNDHVGFLFASENGQIFGFTDEETAAIQYFYENGAEPDDADHLHRAFDKVRQNWIRITGYGASYGVNAIDAARDLDAVQKFLLNQGVTRGKIFYSDWYEDVQVNTDVESFLNAKRIGDLRPR